MDCNTLIRAAYSYCFFFQWMSQDGKRCMSYANLIISISDKTIFSVFQYNLESTINVGFSVHLYSSMGGKR